MSLARGAVTRPPKPKPGWTKCRSGGIRDQAASTFVATVANSDPAKAYQWAVSIADPALRRDAAEQSLKAWKANGQLEQARSALQQAEVFSEQDLRELRKAIE